MPGRSQFLFLQGHPEYGAETLGREYLRDMGRFLRGESAERPAVPENYFDRATENALAGLDAQTQRPGRSGALYRGGVRGPAAAILAQPYREIFQQLAGPDRRRKDAPPAAVHASRSAAKRAPEDFRDLGCKVLAVERSGQPVFAGHCAKPVAGIAAIAKVPAVFSLPPLPSAFVYKCRPVGAPDMAMACFSMAFGWFLAVLALCGAGYAVLAALAAGRFMRAARVRASAPMPPSPSSSRFIAASRACRKIWKASSPRTSPRPVQIVFGVHDEADPAHRCGAGAAGEISGLRHLHRRR